MVHTPTSPGTETAPLPQQNGGRIMEISNATVLPWPLHCIVNLQAIPVPFLSFMFNSILSCSLLLDCIAFYSILYVSKWNANLISSLVHFPSPWSGEMLACS